MNKRESKIPRKPDCRGQTSARAISEAPLCRQAPAEQLPDSVKAAVYVKCHRNAEQPKSLLANDAPGCSR